MVARCKQGPKMRGICVTRSPFHSFLQNCTYPCAAMFFTHGLRCESKFTYGMAKRSSFCPRDDKRSLNTNLKVNPKVESVRIQWLTSLCASRDFLLGQSQPICLAFAPFASCIHLWPARCQ